MKLRWIATTFVLAVAVAACGGGGGGGSVAPITPGGGGITTANTPVPTSPASSQPVSTATGGSSKVTMSILIPKATTSSSSTRSSKYIPSNTASLTMQLLSVNGTAQSGSLQGPFNLTAPTPTNPNPNCQVVSNGTKCSFQIDAPIGNDVFVANSFAQANGVSPLGSGSVAITVQSNATNTTGLTLSGPVASVSVVTAIQQLSNGNPPAQPTAIPYPTPPSYSESARRAPTARTAAVRAPQVAQTPTVATSSRVFVIALDAAGNQIINPTTYDIPIALKLNLNGAPANVLQLSVAYAGLTASDTGSASTSTDGGTVTIYAPSDQITLSLVGALPTPAAYLSPTLTASYTPQGGLLQTTQPLVFVVGANPPTASLTLSQSFPSPFPQPTGIITVTVGNTGTAASGSLTVLGFLSNAGLASPNPFGTTSSTFWSCSVTSSNSYYYATYTCTSNSGQSVASNTSAPAVFLNVLTNPNYPGFSHDAVVNNVAESSATIASASATPSPTPSPNPSASPYTSLVATSAPTTQPFYSQVSSAFTVLVYNYGNAATSSTTTITDTLDANVAYNTYAGTGWTCGGSAPTITCTTTQTIAGYGGVSSPLNIFVTPQTAAIDGYIQNIVGVAGGTGGQTSVAVSSPLVFSNLSGTFNIGPQYGTSFTPGDIATLDFGGVPNPLPSGQLTLAPQYSYMYQAPLNITNDTCTGSVLDSQLHNAIAAVSGSSNNSLNFPIAMPSTGPNAPANCSISIQDANSQTATLNISIEQTSVTIQSRKRR